MRCDHAGADRHRRGSRLEDLCDEMGEAADQVRAIADPRVRSSAFWLDLGEIGLALGRLSGGCSACELHVRRFGACAWHACSWIQVSFARACHMRNGCAELMWLASFARASGVVRPRVRSVMLCGWHVTAPCTIYTPPKATRARYETRECRVRLSNVSLASLHPTVDRFSQVSLLGWKANCLSRRQAELAKNLA
nr:hypothetical protein Iba_chr10dCG9980 [Ipomoea batatas]